MGRSGDLPRVSGELDGDDGGCHVLHVDMDAFFVSVEVRARPELRGLPVAVGGTQGRGVVAAASYAARAFGVRSAMPMGQALRLCPQLIVVPPTRGAYSEASRSVMAIFADVTPVVEPMSLDEAFLDIAGAVGLFGRPVEIARLIRRRVRTELHLTCSVGIAPVKSVAKLASGSCKPDGLRVVSRAGIIDFLHPLPVTALAGVGDRTADQLHRLGIRSVADLAATPLDTLRRAVGAVGAHHLMQLANGRDDRVVRARAAEKSISSDRTLERDLLHEAQVSAELLRGAGDVTARLRSAGMQARTVGIKIRFADFSTITRVQTLNEPTDVSAMVHAKALALYRNLKLDRPRIRLVGVKVENLVSLHQPTQLMLDLSTDPDARAGPDPATARQAQRAIELVGGRFPDAALMPASLVGRRSPASSRSNEGRMNSGEPPTGDFPL